MKIIQAILFFSVITIGCTNQSTKINDNKVHDTRSSSTNHQDTLSIIKSFKTDTILGKILIRTFEGSIAARSHYSLIIYNQEYSGDGQFAISILDNTTKKLFVAQGKRYTLKGENDSTLWQFVTDDDKYTFDFLVNNEKTITLVNNTYGKEKPILNLISSKQMPY